MTKIFNIPYPGALLPYLIYDLTKTSKAYL